MNENKTNNLQFELSVMIALFHAAVRRRLVNTGVRLACVQHVRSQTVQSSEKSGLKGGEYLLRWKHVDHFGKDPKLDNACGVTRNVCAVLHSAVQVSRGRGARRVSIASIINRW